MEDDEDCPNCKELARVAGVITDVLKKEGIECGQALIVMEFNRCHKTLIPDCNMNLIHFALAKILDRVAKAVFENLAGKGYQVISIDAPDIKRQVSEYLNGINKNKERDHD